MKRLEINYNARASEFIKRFSEASVDIRLLIEAHSELLLSESGKNEADDKDTVFLRSAYVLLSSAWERFVEDIVIAGSKFMLENIDISRIPMSLKKQIAKNIKKDKNELSPWDLAGDGWGKKIYEHIEEQVNSLNTPKTKNIDILFQKVFGITITESWHWEYEVTENNIVSFPVELVSSLIDEFVSARGGIAHGKEARDAKIPYFYYINNIILKIISIINNEMSDYLLKLTGNTPWEKVSYNNDWRPFIREI